MLNKLLTLLLLSSAAVMLNSCQRNYVSLDYTNAKGEVPDLGNLVFKFSKSVYPDSLLNRWDSTEYISFTPAIPGRFRWRGPEELVFSPSQPLLPATTYKARIGSEVLRFSSFTDIENADRIEFSTSPLVLNDAQVIWVLQDESSRTAVPQINLAFNYPVDLDELKSKLHIKVEGHETAFSMIHTGTGKHVSLKLDGFKAEDKDYETRLSIDAGLKPENGGNALKDPITTILSIPSPFVLHIQQVESEHDGTQGLIHVYTSQRLTGENMQRFIRFDPSIPFSIQHEDYGFTIQSEKFDAEGSYTFTISSGMRGRIGGVLKEPYNGSVAFGQLQSDISFTSKKAVYLSRKGAGNIEVNIINTPKVRLVISRIYENNLLMAQRYGYYPRLQNEEYDYYEDDSYGNAMAGDVIYDTEIDTRSLPKSGGGRILNVSQFEDRIPDAKGIYHVMIRSSEDYWVRDSRFISFSDIGLMARHGRDKVFVFANSIKTTASIPGVTVHVYGANNQLLGTAATNESGVAEVDLISRNYDGFKPAMVVARTADDFNYLPFSGTRVNTSRFDVGGKKNNVTGLEAYVYPERDIYRPGETVNFSVIVRDREWKSPGTIPVKMKLLMPNGKELRSLRKALNEQGATEAAIAISSAAITGSYTLEVYSSNDVLLTTQNFMIEEFVPDRIRVNAKLDKSFLRPGEEADLQIGAMNFFGPPAANRNYETEIQVRQKNFFSKNYPGFDFSLVNQRSFFDKDIREGKTDAEGNAAISYEVPSMYANSGLLQASFYTTVFDETGRPVSRVTSADIFTQDVFHGIMDDGYYYYALNQPVSFQLVSLNREGKAMQARARVQVIKHEYRTVLARSGSYFRYDSQKEERVMLDKEMNVGDKTAFSYIPVSPGDYEVRVYRPGANTYVGKSFYSYGSWSWGSSNFEVNNEGHVDIELDKEGYLAGDKAKLLFKTPFSGRMLVTVETDHLVSYQYVDVSKRTATLDLDIKKDHVPNIYITATLIKPHEVSDIPLTVAHGFQNIRVEEDGRRIPVQITAAKSSRSRTRQKVSVKAIPGSYVSLAAVDNGVLQVSGFKTPDPYAYYYQKRALGVTAFDIYPLLFPELRSRLSSTGGDGEINLEKRVNPMQAKRVRIMSYWSGLKKAGSNGVAEFEFDVPQFSGEIRLMAVAFRDQKFGSSESTTTIADPIVLSSALPRFMSPGDTVLMPVTISNTTGKPATGNASITVKGPVKILGSSTKQIQVPANSEARAEFRIVADPTISIAHISVQVNALGEKFSEETEISVRPPSTLQKISGSGSIVGGSSQKISIPEKDFMDGSFGYELVVNRSSLVELADHMRYLVQYPYGCTEQVVSSAFPQLYFSDFADLLGNSRQKQNANNNVLEAIRKIKMRQLYNGAVMLWDNAGREDWWTTIYAAHFLLEARKAGFDIDNSLIETMLSYLTNRLRSKETIVYYYNRDQNKKIAPKEVAYSLYVLAIAGTPQVASMNYYKSNQAMLALDSRYLLSAAYAVAGDKKSFQSMLPPAFSGEESVQQTGGSFYSALRDEAIALNMLIDVDPGNAQIPVMRQHVLQRLKNDRYANTQERAFTFLAMGKLARAEGKSDVTAEVRVNGRTVSRVEGNWKGNMQQLGGTEIEVSTKGSGRIYYTWIAEGISRSGSYNETDQYVRVRRKFFDRHGNLLSSGVFKQNDLVIVEISLEKSYSNPIENIVITDLLPAGFEIENPRTKEIPGMDWISNASEPVALDVRDDRIHLFVDARNQVHRYYYAVRAVSPGKFRQGPVSADAMYNGEIHSYHGARDIEVIR